MSRENDSVIFKLLKSADVINDDTQEISQQFDGESYPKLPEASMLELGEVALNIAKDYEVIAIKNNEGEIVYLPFNVAIRLLTLEGDVADLAQYTEESVETLSAATVSIYNNLEEFKVEISNRLTQEIKKITDVIPNDTTSGNPLTNEAFVNSSISTNTATFRGTFNLVSDLHLTTSATTYEIAAALATVIPTSDNNDYSFVQIPTSDTETTEIQRVDRYKYNGSNWVFEYSLNNSGFTAKQWAAINSGIVAGLVVKLEDLPNKAELDALFDAKQDKLTFDNTPRYGSNNPVTSGGIKGAVDERLPLSGGTVTGDLILNIGYGTNVSLKANSNRNFLRFNDSYNGYIIGDGNVRLALETGNVDLKHRYTTSSGATDYVVVDARNIQENLTPNLKTLNGTSIVGTGDIDIKDIYLAMYRVTPYSRLMEAYWRGKAILVMGFDGIVYFLSKITVSEALFTHFDQTTMTVSSFTVNTSNVYSDITSQQLQENLVSGENIKTINNNSILGDGNIALQVPIDPSNKLDADYVDDTSSLHKFVSTEEKAKWDAKLPLSGGTMTGDLDLNGNALLVRKSGNSPRNGIKFESNATGVLVGNGNMNLTIQNGGGDLKHRKGSTDYSILDTSNIKTLNNQSIYGSGNLDFAKYNDTLINTETIFCDEPDTIDRTSLYVYTSAYTVKPNQKIVFNDTVGINTLYLINATDISNRTIIKSGKNSIYWNNLGNTDVLILLASSSHSGQTLSMSSYWRGTDNVFITEYGVTNPQDAFNAIEEGKLVIVKKSGIYYQPEQWLTETSIRFVGFGYLNSFNFFDLNSTTWGTVFSYKWQKADEKVSTITGNIDTIKYPTTKAVADYAQPQTAIVSVASGTTTLSAAIDTYYDFAGSADTLTITLPVMTSATTKVKNIIFNLVCGSSPAITINGGDIEGVAQDVVYFANYLIEANKAYEINALWNGTKWVIGASEIAVPTEVEEIEE